MLPQYNIVKASEDSSVLLAAQVGVARSKGRCSSREACSVEIGKKQIAETYQDKGVIAK